MHFIIYLSITETIHMHCGLVKLQNAPSGVNSQVCVSLPTSSKPTSQVYVTLFPSSVSVKLLYPLSGVPGSPQSTKVHKTKVQWFCYLDNNFLHLSGQRDGEGKQINVSELSRF